MQIIFPSMREGCLRRRRRRGGATRRVAGQLLRNCNLMELRSNSLAGRSPALPPSVTDPAGRRHLPLEGKEAAVAHLFRQANSRREGARRGQDRRNHTHKRGSRRECGLLSSCCATAHLMELQATRRVPQPHGNPKGSRCSFPSGEGARRLRGRARDVSHTNRDRTPRGELRKSANARSSLPKPLPLRSLSREGYPPA